MTIVTWGIDLCLTSFFLQRHEHDLLLLEHQPVLQASEQLPLSRHRPVGEQIFHILSLIDLLVLG